MKNSTRSALLAAALSMGLGMTLPAAAQPEVQTGAKSTQIAPKLAAQIKKRITGWGQTASVSYKKRGPGWSHAQVQRMASKKRNQARNRKAHR